MTNLERNERKAANESRRERITDRINLLQEELGHLVREYDDILDEEDKEEHYVKLYDVPRCTWVSTSRDPLTLVFFDHIDGAYSYCISIDGYLVHWNASCNVLVHELALNAPDLKRA